MRRLSSGSVALVLGVMWSSSALAQTNISGGNIVNETWTAAGNPHVISGDIIVPSGAFLHIEPGVDIQITTGDAQASTPDTSRVAISVQGEIVVAGTEAEPVHIHAQAGTSTQTWYGLVVESSASKASFDWMVFEHALNGLDADNSALEVRACEFRTNQNQGVELHDGAAVFDRVLVTNTGSHGVRVSNGSVTMHNVISFDNNSFGFYVINGVVDVFNSASHSNGSYGVYVSGGQAGFVNSLVTENGSYGFYRVGGTAGLSYSNSWGNGNNNVQGSVTQTNNISANPQYVNAALGDLTLQASSVCIDAGTDVNAPDHDYNNVVRPLDGDGINVAEHDIGPHEYVMTPVCGDSQQDAGEQCDDGAANGTYGHCNSNCSGPGPYCGDGNHDVGDEECDDNNVTPGDGCDENCNVESSGTGGSGTGGSGTGGSGTGGSGTGGSATGGSSTGGSGTGANGSGGSATGGSGTGANGSGGDSSGGGSATGPCVPGEQVSCACPGGEQGVQACLSDGTGFDSCSCSGGNDADGEADGGCTISRTDDQSPAVPLALAGIALVAALRRRR